MKLLLMRHGEAEIAARSDTQRSLTAYGCRQVEAVALTLVSRGLVIEKLMVSPYLRARQTAELMAATMAADWQPFVSDALTPETSPADAVFAIDEYLEGSSGLAVTHQPIISGLVFYLTGRQQAMSTAAVAVLEVSSIAKGCCELECVL